LLSSFVLVHIVFKFIHWIAETFERNHRAYIRIMKGATNHTKGATNHESKGIIRHTGDIVACCLADHTELDRLAERQVHLHRQVLAEYQLHGSQPADRPIGP